MADINIYGAIRSMTGDNKAAYASQIYDEALQKFQSEINQEGGGAGAYMVTYNSSTYSEISTAVSDGKVVACYYNSRLYLYAYLDTYHYLICASTSTIYYIRVNSSNTWSNSSTNIESSGNKVSSWSSTTNNTRYPTEKLVKDSLDAKYTKPSGGIPASDLASAVQTSLGKADTAYQKPSSGIPSTDLASGVIPDVSGKEDKSNKVASWSATPTDTHYPSEKLVYDEIGNVEDVLDAILGSATLPTEKKTTIVSASGTTLSADLDNYYLFSSEVGTLAITLPAPNDLSHITKIVFAFTTGSSPAVTFSATAISGTTPPIYAQDGFAIEASTTYEVNAIFNGVCWVVASLKIGASAISSSSSS